VGIGGIGVSALARMMLSEGKEVSGSDLGGVDIVGDLRKLGAVIYKGHRGSNLSSTTDLVVYSSAVQESNPERQQAFDKKIPQLSYFEALGLLSRRKFTIAVSGTNGKTTTTAMLGLILERAGFDPTVVVGSKVREFGGDVGQGASNFRPGKSKYFVVEACEYQAHMLELNPQVIVLTNIEKDHLDYYRGLAHIRDTFQSYIDKLPVNGVLVLNVDDAVAKKFRRPKGRVITYGLDNNADVMAKNISVKDGCQRFDVCFKKSIVFRFLVSPSSDLSKNLERIFGFSLYLPGRFNIYNALAAVAGSLSLGIKPEEGKEVIENFTGTWRRFEKIGTISIPGHPIAEHPIVISDYAHHPTAIQGTIQGTKDFYPSKRLMVVFQPHQRNRTRKLFNDFVRSFSGVDLLIISEIYDVAGREKEEDRDISSKDLVKEIKKRFKGKKVFYAKDLKQTKDLVLRNINLDDLVLIMGAGDIDSLARNLVK